MKNSNLFPGTIRLAFPATIICCIASSAVGSDMELSLQVKSAKQRMTTKHTEEEPSPVKPAVRQIFTSEHHESLLISWKATNAGKKETFEDVLIHCIVVGEKELGQKTVPGPKDEDPVQESAITMDFKPGGSAAGEFSLLIDKPGNYLVRVETRNMTGKHGHEHYASFDLICK